MHLIVAEDLEGFQVEDTEMILDNRHLVPKKNNYYSGKHTIRELFLNMIEDQWI